MRTLAHLHTLAGSLGLAKRTFRLPPNPQDKERLLRVVHEYRDAIQQSRLNITSVQEIYDNFRLTLGGDLRTTWDQPVAELLQTLVPPTAAALATAVAAGLPPPPATNWVRTDANFLTDGVPHFLRRFFPSNAFLIQQKYTRTTMKPKALDVYALSGRLRLLNTLSQYLPGSGNLSMFTTSIDEKNAFFRMMLPQWQLKFSESGHELDDPTYSYDHLVQFMANQQVYHDAALVASSRMQPPSRPSFICSGTMGRGRNYHGRAYEHRGPGHAPSLHSSNRYHGSTRGRGAARSFTPHRQVNQPHQTPTRHIAPRGCGYASHGPATYTAPRTRQQFRQQQRQTRSGRGPPARRNLFSNNNQNYLQEHYYVDDPFQDTSIHHDTEDHFFVAPEQPTEADLPYHPSIHEPHQPSSAAPPAPNETQQDQFYSMEGVHAYDNSDPYTQNDWLQDY